MNKRLTFGLILSSCIFAGSIILFFLGVSIPIADTAALVMVCIGFMGSWISVIGVVKCKKEIDTVLAYGLPIYKANQTIVDIINKSTKHGVKELHKIMEKSIQEEIKKSIEEDKK